MKVPETEAEVLRRSAILVIGRDVWRSPSIVLLGTGVGFMSGTALFTGAPSPGGVIVCALAVVVFATRLLAREAKIRAKLREWADSETGPIAKAVLDLRDTNRTDDLA